MELYAYAVFGVDDRETSQPSILGTGKDPFEAIDDAVQNAGGQPEDFATTRIPGHLLDADSDAIGEWLHSRNSEKTYRLTVDITLDVKVDEEDGYMTADEWVAYKVDDLLGDIGFVNKLELEEME